MISPQSAGAIPSSRTRSEEVADWIEREILGGSYPPGKRIREAKIAEELSISRAPVREALRLLQGRGLVAFSPRHGAVSVGLTEDTVRQVYGLRVTIEYMLCTRGVPNLRDSDIADLKAIISRIHAAAGSGRLEQLMEGPALAWRYREVIYQASGNHVALDVVRGLRARLATAPAGLYTDEPYLRWLVDTFEFVHESVLAGNPEAVAGFVTAFVARTGDLVIKQFFNAAEDPGADDPKLP